MSSNVVGSIKLHHALNYLFYELGGLWPFDLVRYKALIDAGVIIAKKRDELLKWR